MVALLLAIPPLHEVTMNYHSVLSLRNGSQCLLSSSYFLWFVDPFEAQIQGATDQCLS